MKKRESINREEAAELYRDLRKAMGTMNAKKAPAKSSPSAKGDVKDLAKTIAQSISKSMSKDKSEPIEKSVRSFVAAETADSVMRMQLLSGSDRGNIGRVAAVAMVLIFAGCKVVLGAMEMMTSVPTAEASIQASAPAKMSIITAPTTPKEELRILTSLDARRAELEQRAKKLDEQEMDLARRDKEFVSKLAELRELTDILKIDRTKSEKKKNGQLDQLANVYGSMAPAEAAALMEQLDITIALSLMERMPEKRIGQILALMTPERALAITRMLSGGNGLSAK